MAANLRDFFSPGSEVQVYTSPRNPPTGIRESVQWLQSRKIPIVVITLATVLSLGLNGSAKAQDLTQSAPKLYAASKTVTTAQKNALLGSFRSMNEQMQHQQSADATGNITVSLETGIIKGSVKHTELKSDKPRNRGSSFTPGMS